MKTEQHHFIIRGGPPPVVEVDSRAGAVYVRFKRTQVAKTVPQACEAMNINVDLDAKGEVVGIEAIGITQFTLKLLLQKASVKAPQLDYSRARYVPSELVAAN